MAQTKVKLISDGVIDVGHLASGHGITTDNIGEGSNLYYTDARVSTYLSTNNYATESWVNTNYLALSGGTLTGDLIVNADLGIGTSNPQAHIHEVSSIVTNMILEETSAGYAANLILKNTADSFTISSDANPAGLYITSNSDPNSLAEGLFFIKNTGNIGIGTSNPTANLHISSTGDAVLKIEADTDNAGTENDNPSILLSQDGGTTTATIALNGDANNAFTGATSNAFYINSTNNQIYAVANNPVLFLESTGNVGLNMSDPQYPLDLYYREETGTDTTLIRLTNDVVSDLSQQSSFIDFRFLDSNSNETPQVRIGAEVGQNADANSQEKEGSGAFVVYTNNADTTSGDAGASLAERFRVDYKGDVGIGTSSPDRKLEVRSDTSGDVVLARFSNRAGTGSEGAYIGFSTGYGAEATIGAKREGAENDSSLIFSPMLNEATTEAMRITSSGNVGIGTTSPTHNLHVYDAIGNVQATFESGDTTVWINLKDSASGVYGALLGAEGSDFIIAPENIRTAVFKSNNKVGLGTTSPDVELHVKNTGNVAVRVETNSTTDSTTIQFADSDDPGAGRIAYDHSIDAMLFYTNGVEEMRLDSSGQLGIGTTSPSVPLEIRSGSPRIRLTDTGGGYSELSANATDLLIKVDPDNVVGSSTIQFEVDGSEYMRIATNGNIGIGTTVPEEKLDVRGTIKITSDNAAHLILDGDNNNSGDTGQTDSIIDFLHDNEQYGYRMSVQNYGGAQSFKISDNKLGTFTDAFVIDTGLNVCIGTDAAISAYGLLHVKGSQKGITIQDVNGPYRSMYLNNSGNFYFYNGSNEGYLSSSGAWTNASDLKIKKNIVDIKYGLDDIIKTQPRSYQMKDSDIEQFGFIAQELKEIMPECVSGEEERQLGIAYGPLVAVAFKAIQEQQEIINNLKAEVEALKQQLNG